MREGRTRWADCIGRNLAFPPLTLQLLRALSGRILALEGTSRRFADGLGVIRVVVDHQKYLVRFRATEQVQPLATRTPPWWARTRRQTRGWPESILEWKRTLPQSILACLEAVQVRPSTRAPPRRPTHGLCARPRAVHLKPPFWQARPQSVCVNEDVRAQQRVASATAIRP